MSALAIWACLCIRIEWFTYCNYSGTELDRPHMLLQDEWADGPAYNYKIPIEKITPRRPYSKLDHRDGVDWQ